MLILLSLVCSFLPQDLLAPEQFHAFELTADDPVREGHGPLRSFRYEMQTSDGFVWVYAESRTLDLMLRIQVPEGAGSHLLRRTLEAGEWIEDDNAGGGTTPLIQLEMPNGGELLIEVFAKEPGASGQARIHVAESIETPETRPAGRLGIEALQEAQALQASGDLEGARQRLKDALKNLRAVKGAAHSFPVEYLTQEIGYALLDLGDIDSSLEAMEFCLEVQTRIQPRSSRSLQAIQRTSAQLYLEVGRFEEAAALLESCLAALLDESVPDEAALFPTKNGLGSAWILLGRVQEGRELLEQIHDQLVAAGLPDEDPNLLSVRSNLAVALSAIGDFEGALALLERVFAVAEKTFPDDHPQLQIARLNLAASLKNLDRHARARALEEKLLEVYERTLPADHPTLLLARLNLAATLKALGEIDAGFAIQRQVLERQMATLPDEHPDLQLTRYNVSLTLAVRGELEEARALQEKIVDVASRTVPLESTAYQSALSSLARTMYLQEDPTYRTVIRELAGSVRRRVEQFGMLSSRELEAIPVAASDEIEAVLALAWGGGRDEADPQSERAAFEMCDAIRSSAMIAARLARSVAASEVSRDLRAKVLAAAEEVSRLAGTTHSDHRAFSEALMSRDRLERELLAVALGDEVASSLRQHDPEVIADCLAEDEVAVAYWSYAPPAVSDLPHEMTYIAWVLRRGQPLGRIDLGSAREINELIRSWRSTVASATGETLTLRLGEALRRQLFDPLREHCQEARRIWLVPASHLNALPFDALPLEGELLGDRFEVVLRNSLSELLGRSSAAAEAPPSLVVMGGIDFGRTEPASHPTFPASGDESGGASESLLRSGAATRFERLPGSFQEAEEVERRFRGAFPFGSLEGRYGREANRSAFERLAPQARFVHLATHAWFAPSGLAFDEAPHAADAPGGIWGSSLRDRVRGLAPSLLCGIAFAGANRPGDGFGRVFGVMTGEELRALNLSSCELAVLSACESSLGQELASQRLASLQQSLRAAGARATITSLWKVPDEATLLLMSELYRLLWSEKKTKAEALWLAKRALRDARDANGQPLYATRDWAAWVLSGDPN
ncbi:MAG: CHAT domain-containing tetratricopeptide repeat protein [Planctomycetota bacterium]